MKLPEPNPTLLKAVIDYRKWLKTAEEQFSDDMLTRMDLTPGDVLEETSSGLRYKIESAKVSWSSIGGIDVIIYGRRQYRSGRKAGKLAGSSTPLKWLSGYEKING